MTGEKKGAPHETLFWRWGSQAAVQEMPWKLIMIGERERLLFDITKPDGENIARNLVAKHPDIAAHLEAKLKAWADTLRTPGLPTSLDPHHEDLFAEHDFIPKVANAKTANKGEPEGQRAGLRITPAKESAGIELESITLQGRAAEPQVWRFNPSK